MDGLDERAVGEPAAPQQSQPPAEQPLYTRYSAAPAPIHPVGEPRLVHSLIVATWLGRLVDVLPHMQRKDQGAH